MHLTKILLMGMASVSLAWSAQAATKTTESTAQTEMATCALSAENLVLQLDQTGHFTQLSNQDNHFLHTSERSPILRVKTYETNEMLAPQSLRIKSEKGNVTEIELKYSNEITATVRATANQSWFRFELIQATHLETIDRIEWGPYNTNIEGTVGEFFGVLRTGTHTLGMMSLEPNTEGIKPAYTKNGFWLPIETGGSYLSLIAEDHARSRINHQQLRSSHPVPGLTVLGSAIALYTTEQGEELNLIEQIVIKEGLPYPQYKGEWSKRSKEILRPAIWGHFSIDTIDSFLQLTTDMSAIGLCGFHSMFGNWGHFDPDPKLYPNGMDDIRSVVKKADDAGVSITMYTLTNFTKPKSVPEPFISPVPDPRFEKYDITSALNQAITEDSTTIHMDQFEGYPTFKNRQNKKGAALLIGNEIILAKKMEIVDEKLVFSELTRGGLKTHTADHAKGSNVEFFFYSGYNNLYPGTMAMSNDLARNIGNKSREGQFKKVTLDGHESSTQTGHGPYAMNMTQKIIYDLNKDREDMVYTGSRITNYCWNMISYISWGEHDKRKGVRGTMLDYRIHRQVQLDRSLMPRKLGQHYPAEMTVDDMNWLMGTAVGWNSGVEFHVGADQFYKQDNHKEVSQTVRLWEKARLSGTVTEAQKLSLRQVNRVHSIAEKADGTWDIQVKHEWTHEQVQIVPSDIVKIETTSENIRVTPASTPISSLHSPLVAEEATLSNDIHIRSNESEEFQLILPGKAARGRDAQQFQFVLRVPETATTAIVNPKITVGNETFVIPVTLQPGQYLAAPLKMPLLSVYNKNHEVLKEVHLRHQNDLPQLKRGAITKVKVHLTPENKQQKASAILNVYHIKPILEHG